MTVKPVHLDCQDNTDLSFAVRWLAPDGTTPVDITSARFAMRAGDGTTLIIDTGLSIVANEVTVIAHAEDLAPLTGKESIRWELVAKSVTGARRRMAWGTAKVADGIGVAL